MTSLEIRIKNSNNHNKVKKLYSGANGTVYLCKSESEYYAVKTIKNLDTNDSKDGISRETMALVALSEHPNLVKFYHSNFIKGCLNIYIEYIDGGNLGQRLEKSPKLSFDEIRKIVKQLCEGVNHLHECHVMHRDIKPQNILLTTEGVVKITDFNTAKYYNEHCRKDQTFCGTQRYMAPEMIESKDYSYPVDIWAIGVTLIEILTGEKYFSVYNPQQYMCMVIKNEIKEFMPKIDNLDKRAEYFLRLCMEKNTNTRGDIKDLLSTKFLLL